MRTARTWSATICARYIEELEKKMRDAAANLEFEEAGRLRDEIRSLEAEELGLPREQRKAPVMGRSNEGKPGTRKDAVRQVQRKWRGVGRGGAIRIALLNLASDGFICWSRPSSANFTLLCSRSALINLISRLRAVAGGFRFRSCPHQRQPSAICRIRRIPRPFPVAVGRQRCQAIIRSGSSLI